MSRQPSLNILQHKKQITLPNRIDKGPAVVVKKEGIFIYFVLSVCLFVFYFSIFLHCIIEPTEVGRVRRSLHFGVESPRKKTRTKSPAKTRPALQCLDDDEAAFQPLLQLTTPSKSSGNSLFTPLCSTLLICESTFSYAPLDFILAPETPSRLRSGVKSARKTDGVHVVGESPEVKQEGKAFIHSFLFQL